MLLRVIDKRDPARRTSTGMGEKRFDGDVSSLQLLPGARPFLATLGGEGKRMRFLLAASLGIHAGGVLMLLAGPERPVATAPASDWAVTVEIVSAPSPQTAPTDVVVPDRAMPDAQQTPPADEPQPVPAEPTAAEPPPINSAEAPPESPPPQPTPVAVPLPPPAPRPTPPARRAESRPSAAARHATSQPDSTSVPTAFARASPPALDLPLIPPRPVAGMASNRPPVYPDLARRRGQEGRVMLRVDVSTEGMPVAVGVATSSGHSVLDQAAIAAVWQWRFVAGTRGGTAVPAAAEVPLLFTLDK
jgi:protein TonB